MIAGGPNDGYEDDWAHIVRIAQNLQPEPGDTVRRILYSGMAIGLLFRLEAEKRHAVNLLQETQKVVADVARQRDAALSPPTVAWINIDDMRSLDQGLDAIVSKGRQRPTDLPLAVSRGRTFNPDEADNYGFGRDADVLRQAESLAEIPSSDELELVEEVATAMWGELEGDTHTGTPFSQVDQDQQDRFRRLASAAIDRLDELDGANQPDLDKVNESWKRHLRRRLDAERKLAGEYKQQLAEAEDNLKRLVARNEQLSEQIDLGQQQLAEVAELAEKDKATIRELEAENERLGHELNAAREALLAERNGEIPMTADEIAALLLNLGKEGPMFDPADLERGGVIIRSVPMTDEEMAAVTLQKRQVPMMDGPAGEEVKALARVMIEAKRLHEDPERQARVILNWQAKIAMEREAQA
jgi:hypothetical protein